MSEKKQSNIETICDCVICAIQWTLLGMIILLSVKGCIYMNIIEMETKSSKVEEVVK